MKHFSGNVYIALIVLPVLFFTSCGSLCNTSRTEETHADGSRKSPKHDKLLIEKYETLLGIRIENTSLPLYRSIDGWLGVPYKYGGTGKQGTDCSGFVWNIYREAYEITLPRSTDEQFKLLQKVKQKNLEEGHLVFFKIEKGKKVSHVGIYLGNNKFVHASTSKGVRIDDLTQVYYKDTFIGGGAVKLP